MEKRKSKLIHLSEGCIIRWSKFALDNGMTFKTFVEKHLEEQEFKLLNSFEKTAVRGTKKNKNK